MVSCTASFFQIKRSASSCRHRQQSMCGSLILFDRCVGMAFFCFGNIGNNGIEKGLFRLKQIGGTEINAFIRPRRSRAATAITGLKVRLLLSYGIHLSSTWPFEGNLLFKPNTPLHQPKNTVNPINHLFFGALAVASNGLYRNLPLPIISVQRSICWYTEIGSYRTYRAKNHKFLYTSPRSDERMIRHWSSAKFLHSGDLIF